MLLDMFWWTDKLRLVPLREADCPMKLLVFQHIDCEHPGILREFLRADGIEYRAVELDAGEEIPALEDYDALWVMGGPMDVWDIEEHPWLVPEKRAIRRWITDSSGPFWAYALATSSWPIRLVGHVARSVRRRLAFLTLNSRKPACRIRSSDPFHVA